MSAAQHSKQPDTVMANMSASRTLIQAFMLLQPADHMHITVFCPAHGNGMTVIQLHVTMSLWDRLWLGPKAAVR